MNGENVKTSGLFMFIKVVIALYFLFSLFLLSLFAINLKSKTEEVLQPINFSHKKHAGENGIECTFCHFYADKSTNASVPPVQKCMDCHSVIATDKPEIQKLTSYWNKKEPVPWLRVYALPEHVYFSHKRHIKKGIDCSVCHGDVKNTERIRQVRSLKMGWCVNCHRQFGGSTDCLTCHK
jgi:hypothetical protein